MFAMFWPFDWSFSGFCFCAFMFLWWTAMAAKAAAKDAAKKAKDVAESETGRGFLAVVLETIFKK